MRDRARTVVLSGAAAAVLAWCWLRLGRPHAGSNVALWLIALAVVPALLPRLSWRLAALAAAAVLALHTAFHVWIVHPLRLLGRFGGGFLEFYDVKLPFLAAHHPRMQGVILVALFASCAAVALAVVARRPVLAGFTFLVAAGWPATLLSGPDDRWRGAAILAVLLSLVAGLGGRLHFRRLAVASFVGAAVVAAAFGVSGSSAVASGQVLHWQSWDFYTKPQKPVGVEYVWNSNYGGLKFPKKVTVVLRIKARSRPIYWRATTLDEFDGGNWFESVSSVQPVRIDGRDELIEDEEFPPAAGNSSNWVKEDVTDTALRDNHLIGGSVPVAYESGARAVDYSAGGVAYLQDKPLSPGDHYTAWSYQATPTPQQLARLNPRYPKRVRANDLYIEARTVAPAFGTPNREAKLAEIFHASYRVRQYRRFYEIARNVVGQPANPYAAALELEGWFRSGAFRYDEHPPQIANVPPLAAFVTHTRAGYCQHFAGAMALMLRYLGIPARVAAGFTSGSYDSSRHEWRVTDHDAHTWVEAWFPRYGWLPFDPTPGRGNLEGPYTTSSLHFDLSDGLRALGATLKRPTAGFNLRKLKRNGAPAQGKAHRGAKPQRASGGAGFGALLKLLVFVAAALVALVALTKLLVRKRRYLTRDPRRRAGAYAKELADFVADQGARAPASATFRELAELVDQEFGVSARPFAEAATVARFGPARGAGDAAREAGRQLKGLRRELRRVLSRSERALGLVSLRSLGLTG